MDEIEKLKAIKAPLWSRILGNWRARRAAKRVRKEALKRENHIATVTCWCALWGKKERIMFLCYERGDGTRHFRTVETNGLLDKYWKRTGIYAHYIAPWVAGSLSHKALIELAKQSMPEPESQPKDW